MKLVIKGVCMLTFILVSGSVLMVGVAWFAYRLISQSAREEPGTAEINNVGDLNKNNALGKWGLDGL
jgi:hypothetical protein